MFAFRKRTGHHLSTPGLRDSRVTVTGDKTKPVLIMIVLDCSATMETEMKGEAAEATRMGQAKEALKVLLDRLIAIQKESQGSYRVGVILFGHRVNEENGQLIGPDRKPTDPSLGTPIKMWKSWWD